MFERQKIMFYYKLYEMKLKTDFEFPQLIACDDDKEPDIVIMQGEIPQEIIEEKDRKYEFGEKRSWLSNLTCYFVVENGNKITYSLKEGGKLMPLRNYLLGFGMSMVAMQRGILSIHCSALADDKGAILIAGESGAGKSTVTKAFLDKGYHLMADDMSWVETKADGKSYAKPAFPYQKLCRNVVVEQGLDFNELIYINESKDKFLVPYKGEFSEKAVPIKGFIMLCVTNKDKVLSEEIKGFNKMKICANNLFLRHLLGPDKYAPQLGQKCLKMASTMPIYCIGRPDGMDTAQEVIEKAFEIVSRMDEYIC